MATAIVRTGFASLSPGAEVDRLVNGIRAFPVLPGALIDALHGLSGITLRLLWHVPECGWASAGMTAVGQFDDTASA
jgi:hypothetical protein